MWRKRTMWSLIASLPFLTGGGKDAAAGEATFQEWWPDVVTRLERGAFNEKDLREARATCLKGLEGSLKPEQAVLVRYSIAYADWRLVRVPSIQKDEQLPLHDEAAAQLQQALAVDPKNAESLALLAAVYGSQMGFVPALGMELGSKAASALEQAVKLEPDNPRIVLAQGGSAFHTPPAYGGSIEKAEACFRRAISLFASEPPSRPWPNWGRLDAHLWLGILLEKRGDRENARAEYKKTLAIDPEFGWVRFVLLPRLEAKSDVKNNR
jgi:tetratricopeptide (TPR) repeat protein